MDSLCEEPMFTAQPLPQQVVFRKFVQSPAHKTAAATTTKTMWGVKYWSERPMTGRTQHCLTDETLALLKLKLKQKNKNKTVAKRVKKGQKIKR